MKDKKIIELKHVEKILEEEIMESCNSSSTKIREEPSPAIEIIQATEQSETIAMPYMGKTLSYPRTDNVFKKMESLPYDEAHT